ncbi:MAG TPA: tRNA epoxyqueuosine(34) reductase QueG, partial [Candidatus Baltobacteraceae bacterium]|nr:tRNA epoxyqueuosine(34) reductase QueG [Candidatus Baltobacteraceae bacterium]
MDRWQPSELLAIKRAICERAVALGASAARVAQAERSDRDEEQFNAAFERGDLRTWGYDSDYARRAADPASILREARSIISIAVPYRTEQPVRGPMQGRVSNYAWSNDYHSRMQRLLRTLASELDERAGEPVSAVACDTRPLAERAFAARAGIGWVGKHTNLIAPPAGSFVFLGEIVTTLALPPDPALKKTCGSCARCVPACPTGALRGDYTMDASRCISDLTQRTDGIPQEMRPLIGTWVWGCDICQDVCPPNERATVFGSPADEPASAALAAPDLQRLLNLRSGEFKRTYARSAMGWRG